MHRPTILVVGAGGREHALVRALKRSASAPELLAAPGNPGIGEDARLLAIAVDDVAHSPTSSPSRRINSGLKSLLCEPRDSSTIIAPRRQTPPN